MTITQENIGLLAKRRPQDERKDPHLRIVAAHRIKETLLIPPSTFSWAFPWFSSITVSRISARPSIRTG